MELLHCIREWLWTVKRKKKPSCLFKVVFKCLDSAIELVFLLFYRLHIYHASVLVRCEGYMYFLCYVNINNMNMFVWF